MVIDSNQFNFTGLLESLNHVTSQELKHRAPTTLLSSIRSEASDILATTPIIGTQALTAAGAATAVPGVVSQLQSGLEAANTAIPGAVSRAQSALSSAATSLTNYVPVNYSIGMRDFCIGVSCQKLPLGILDLLPEQIKDSLQKELGYLNDATTRATASSLQNCLIAGSTFVLILTIITSLHIFYSITRTLFRTALYLTLCLVCLTLLVIPTAISWVIQSKLQSVPLVTVVYQGEAPKLCLVALCFAFFLMILGLANVIPVSWNNEPYETRGPSQQMEVLPNGSHNG